MNEQDVLEEIRKRTRVRSPEEMVAIENYEKQQQEERLAKHLAYRQLPEYQAVHTRLASVDLNVLCDAPVPRIFGERLARLCREISENRVYHCYEYEQRLRERVADLVDWITVQVAAGRTLVCMTSANDEAGCIRFPMVEVETEERYWYHHYQRCYAAAAKIWEVFLDSMGDRVHSFDDFSLWEIAAGGCMGTDRFYLAFDTAADAERFTDYLGTFEKGE